MANREACAACGHAKRRCPPDCIFAPYFPARSQNERRRFDDVHKIFGDRNVRRMLEGTAPDIRRHLANALCIEARFRIQYPIHGSLGIVYGLQQRIHDSQNQLAQIQQRIAYIRSQKLGFTDFPEPSKFVHFGPPPPG